MPIRFRNSLALAVVTAAAAWSIQSPVQAADPVVGYYARPPERVVVHHHRQPLVVRTTYVVREECDLLKVSDPVDTRIVNICHKPVF